VKDRSEELASSQLRFRELRFDVSVRRRRFRKELTAGFASDGYERKSAVRCHVSVGNCRQGNELNPKVTWNLVGLEIPLLLAMLRSFSTDGTGGNPTLCEN
jgi:hypothetical protein